MRPYFRYAAVTLLLVGAPLAFAQDDTDNQDVYVGASTDNTDSGTTVNNIVTVEYMLDGNPQTAVDNDPEGDGTGLTFVVDRAIIVTVDAGAGVSVAPNSDDKYLTYTITNDSNNGGTAGDLDATNDTLLDFLLTTAHGVDGTDDDFNAGTTIWVETNGILGLQMVDPDGAGGSQLADTPTDVLDDLVEEEEMTAYVVGDIAIGAADGETSDVYLVATAYESDGTAGTVTTLVTEDTGADDPNAVDTVFGDMDGDGAAGGPDDDENGAHADFATFTVAAADVSVNKTQSVISDPFNGTTSPKAIPGAVIQYCILVSNNGADDTESIEVTDPIPANTTFFASEGDELGDPVGTTASSIVIADDCTGTNGTREDVDGTDADDTDGESGVFDGTNVITVVDDLPAGEQTATIFRVTVD